MNRVTTCTQCGNELGKFDQTCQKCGTASSYGADEPQVACTVCGTSITAYTETCPGCGENGYPALRPRRGKGFKGAPEDPENAAQ